jgi:7-carboxy-7-deazaguanine synthase
MKTYLIKKIFGPTIQGEGSLAGTVTTFIRFGGCNMWDGRLATRGASKCPYCDTDFFGGDHLTVDEIVERVSKITRPDGWVTLSGGEPLLQLDFDLASALYDEGFSLAVETNGTRILDPRMLGVIEKIILSPKVPREEIALKFADDLKVLYPHPNPKITPEAFQDFPAENHYLQPVNWVDELDLVNVALTVDKLQTLDGWKLSLQMHKAIGVE